MKTNLFNGIRVLVLSSCLPYPPDDGIKIRAFYTLDQMVKLGYIVTLLCFTGKDDLDNMRQLESKLGINVIEVPKRKKLNQTIEHLYFSFFSNYPYPIGHFNSRIGVDPRFETELNQCIKTGDFHILYVSDPYMSLYGKSLILPKIIDSIDCQSANAMQGFKSTNNRLIKIYWYLNHLKWMKLERIIYPMYNNIITTSDRDTIKLRVSVGPNLKISTIPNGIDLSYFKPMGLDKIPKSMIFLGTLDAFSNQEAIMYFMNEIYPSIREKMPDIVLFIVGKNAPEKILKLHDGKNIYITGYVDDVRPYIDRSEIVICPLKMATGIQNKVLIGLAMNKAIISTKAGVGDIADFISENDMVIVDSKHEFTQKLTDLLSGRFKEIGNDGRKIIEDHYSWESFGDRLNNIILSLMPKN